MPEAYTLMLCHFIGDYYLQSDWMALNKHKQSLPCLVHVLLYTACFVPFVHSIPALFFIAATHFIVDRFSVVKYMIWLKNHLNPSFSYPPFSDCSVTGYDDQRPNAARPFWLTLTLYIVTDNSFHLICNELIRTRL